MASPSPDPISLQAQALAMLRRQPFAAAWSDDEQQARLIVMALRALSDAAKHLKDSHGQTAHSPLILQVLDEAGAYAVWALNNLRPQDGAWSGLRLDNGFQVGECLCDVLIALLALSELAHRDLLAQVQERVEQ